MSPDLAAELQIRCAVAPWLTVFDGDPWAVFRKPTLESVRADDGGAIYKKFIQYSIALQLILQLSEKRVPKPKS
jgi:hypothetical protein